MISSEAKHPNCMYMWMNWIVSPKVNAEVAEFFGEAPAQSLACEHTENKNFCTEYHADNPAFWKRVYYWETPLSECGNGAERLQELQRLGPGLDLDQRLRHLLGEALSDGDRRTHVHERSAGHRLAGLFYGRPRLQVGALLARPIGWLVIGYLGSLAVLLIAAFWTVNPLSGEVVHDLQPRKLQDADQRTGLQRDRLAHGPDRRCW